MKIRILVDNNTLIDEYFYGEPGVSYLIEEDDKKILFDLGFSDVFLINADKMGINLLEVECIVFSHGHLDHTRGISHLIKYYLNCDSRGLKGKTPKIMAHPQIFDEKVFSDEQIGFNEPQETLSGRFELLLSKEPVWISEKLVFLGEIERTNEFENKIPIGKTIIKGFEYDDYVLDDSALAYKAKEGLVIITACSHSGICNIINYAKKVCNDDRILDIIGGFHLLRPKEELMANTRNFIEGIKPRFVYASHCTDLKSKIELSKVADIKEVGVGLELKYE